MQKLVKIDGSKEEDRSTIFNRSESMLEYEAMDRWNYNYKPKDYHTKEELELLTIQLNALIDTGSYEEEDGER